MGLNGYESMLGMMANFASDYLQPAWEKQKLGENHELPTDVQFTEIFYGFTELGSALDALKLSEQLLHLAPPRSKKIDKENYLRFLVSSYLQEMYILEQRLTAYAKKLSRMYGKPSLVGAVDRIVFQPLKGILQTRGAHVHQRRYSDKRLDMVSTTALFRRVQHQLGDDFEIDYKIAQLDWGKRVKSNNETTNKIIDAYCELVKAVICKDGKIFLPSVNFKKPR